MDNVSIAKHIIDGMLEYAENPDFIYAPIFKIIKINDRKSSNEIKIHKYKQPISFEKYYVAQLNELKKITEEMYVLI